MKSRGDGALDGLAVDPLGSGPVEVRHGLEPAELAAPEAPLEAAACAVLGLVVPVETDVRLLSRRDRLHEVAVPGVLGEREQSRLLFLERGMHKPAGGIAQPGGDAAERPLQSESPIECDIQARGAPIAEFRDTA
jgi:hypothetical protein